MSDAYDENASYDEGLSLDLIEEEIEAGLPLHADRLVAAFDCEEYYAGRNAAYVKRRPSEEWTDYVVRPKRASKLTRKVVRTLTQDLYAVGPTRKLADPAADAWLGDVYARNHVNALLQQADRKATLHGLAAVQATGTGRTDKPVLLSLWGAHELVWWTWPDDPTEAWAVCTIARLRQVTRNGLQQRLRLEAWSRDEHRTYLTKWVDAPPECDWAAMGYRGLFGTPATIVPELSGEPAGTCANPYGRLPFAFVHDEIPVSRFDEGGIGRLLVECNAEVDRELSDVAEHVQKYLNPIGYVKNVPPGFRVEKRPGGFLHLVPSKAVAEGDQKAEPELGYLQAKLAVAEAWQNIQAFADSTMEELDVPLVVVRDSASTDLSGVAIFAKQLPLTQRTRARQVPFGIAEDELAALVLTVGGNFYREPRLIAAAQDPGLALVWPDPTGSPVPSQERDMAATFELDNHMKSLVMVVAERYGLTRDGAIAHIKAVARDNDLVHALLPPAQPEAVGTRAGELGDPDPVVMDSKGVQPLVATGQESAAIQDQNATAPATKARPAPPTPPGK